MTIAIAAITTTHDTDADRTADFDRMNNALLHKAFARFPGENVTLADSPDEMNLLVRGNGYTDRTDDLADVYETIVCDPDYYTLVNGLDEGAIQGLADEALASEGFEAYFPGLDPDTCLSSMLADYLVAHPEDWTNDGDSWSFDGDPTDVAAFAVERGAQVAE